jgi:acyl-CoA thioester hydrolase
MEFVWPIRVYYEDTDAGGVVFYANYLRFMERARTEWLRSLGFEQDALMRDPGVLFAVRRTEVDYLSPARFNELLQVSSRVVRMRGAALTFEQRIASDDEAQRELCRGLVTVACLDSASMRPPRIPAAIREKIPTTD